MKDLQSINDPNYLNLTYTLPFTNQVILGQFPNDLCLSFLSKIEIVIVTSQGVVKKKALKHTILQRTVFWHRVISQEVNYYH